MKNFNKKKFSKIKKIKIHCGIGSIKTSEDIITYFFEQLKVISGQKPKMIYAKRPIAGFNLREKMPLGFYVTLRQYKMISFFNRLVKIILPQNFSFEGIPQKKFDGKGNLNIGLKTFFEFRECDSIKFYKYSKIGFNISIVTSYKTDIEALTYLNQLGLLTKDLI
uniref:ribosomal protein L5 n=1 Tax=Prototheca pringsheimii TaxID=2509260 RepID=UPI00300234B9